MGTDEPDHERHLRRADADVLRHRPVRSQGAGGAAQVLRRDEDARRGARHEQALHRGVPANWSARSTATMRIDDATTVAIRVKGVSHHFGEEGDARHVRGAARYLARHRARRAALPDRAERLRQVDAAQRHRRPDGARPPARSRSPARPCAGRCRATSPSCSRRTRCFPGTRCSRTSISAWCSRACRGPSARRARSARSKPSGSRTSRSTIPPSSPAACASARRSRARSASRPASC